MAAGDIIVVSEDGSGKKGVYFDGTDDYILADAHAVARVAANDTTGTYTAWIFKDSIAVNQEILSAGDNDSGNEYLILQVTGLGQLKVVLRQGGASQFSINQTTGTIIAKRWTHVAVVQDGIQPKLYVDGANVAATNGTATDLTMWYDELANCDKFAIGVLESNGTHTEDWIGAIGPIKYWNRALTSDEVKRAMAGEALTDDATYLQYNLTMTDDGTTDSGLGLDNGTLIGNAYYGGKISTWSKTIESNVTGHAAEKINTVIDGNKYVAIIERGD